MNIKMKSNRQTSRKKSTQSSIRTEIYERYLNQTPPKSKQKKKRVNKHKGFSRHPQIAHGDGCSTGTMICDKCHSLIGKEPYMIVEYYDMHSRGKENDFNKLYHRKCCEHSYPHSWAAYDEERKQTAIRTARRNRMRERLLKVIKAWNFDSEELFGDD